MADTMPRSRTWSRWTGGGRYAKHGTHIPGELVTLPGSVGGKVVLDVERVLKAGAGLG
ncbi:hypothetical protein ABZ027_34770 [Streptomyces sp. NPDC006332]|uniref:hypothetical protein n=1 Tax=Streptomyces sp. NPDC006332 TaxID=3155456 RepID=UPI0033B7E1C1